MRKIISIFLISTLVLTLLCGCEGDNNVSSDVSQIEAVVNMSSEETSSEIENVSSIESIVSSVPEPSSDTTVVSSKVSISSEVSVPKYPDRTEVQYEYEIISKSHDLDFKTYHKMVINSVEDFEHLKKPVENSYYIPSDEVYNSIKEIYDESFFETKSLILYIYSASEPHSKIEIINVTKKDNTIYINSVNYKRELKEDEYIPYGIVNGLLSVEISKSDLENVENIEINETQRTIVQ